MDAPRSLEPKNNILYDQVILQHVNDREAKLLLPVIVYVCILMTIGLLGNSLVIYIYKFRFRRSSARTFILCLALLDTITCLVGMPYHIVDMLHAYMFYNAAACKVLSFTVSLSLLSSTYILLLISVDRYRKICKPLNKQISDLGTRTACSLALVFAALCALPILFLYGNNTLTIPHTNVTGVECFVADTYKNTDLPIIFDGFLFFIFIVCTLGFSIIYTCVGVNIWKKAACESDDLSGGNNGQGKGQWKFCGSNSPQTTEDMLSSNSEEPKEFVRSLSFHKVLEENGQTTVECAMEVTSTEDPVYKPTTVRNKQEQTIKSSIKSKFQNGRSSKKKLDKKRRRAMSATDESSDDERRTRNRVFSIGGESLTSRASRNSRKYRRSIRITLMLFSITVVFVISFLPHLIILVLGSMDDEFWSNSSDQENLTYNFLLRTYFINNMANPIIYGFLDRRFRREIYLMFRRIRNVCKRPPKRRGSAMSLDLSNWPPKSKD